jgi:hypothetical protein
VTVCTWTRHLSLSWARLIHCTLFRTVYLISSLVIGSILWLGIPSAFFPSGFRTKILYAFLFFPYVLHALPISFSWLFLYYFLSVLFSPVSCCFLLLPAASYCFLLLPVASCCFLLLPIASCWFLLLPIASCCFLLLLGASVFLPAPSLRTQSACCSRNVSFSRMILLHGITDVFYTTLQDFSTVAPVI